MPAELTGTRGAVIALLVAAAVLLLLAVLGVLPFARSLTGDVLAFLAALALLLLVVGAVLPTFEDQFITHGAFTALLVVTSFIFPGLAGLATVALYLLLPESHPVHRLAALPGAATGAVLWASLALIFRRLAHADRANPSVYGELVSRLDFLESRVEGLPQLGAPDLLAVRAGVVRQLAACRLGLGQAPDGPKPGVGAVWVYGVGYIEMWQRIHRAEEDLLLIDSLGSVIARGVDSRLRLHGSRIANREQLRRELDAAITTLQAGDSPAGRQTVRTIRRAINTYRDDRWDGMVRARNRLLAGATFTGITAFLLLALATTQGVPTWNLVAATTFYLVGALTGLLQRLYDDARAASAIEDYGLANARMFTGPLVSGIAAVAGVVLLVMLAAAPLGPGPTAGASPSPGAAPGASPAPTAQPAAPSPAITVVYPALTSIFDIQRYPFGLIVAAVFGLTPGLLLNRLRKLADQYALDLQSTEAAEATTPT